jgi:D-3-phosphoglycerate dehydrogenase
VIGRAGVGVDNIDAAAATHRGIVVMNTPGANAVAVAELTIGLMLTMARKIPQANVTMHAGKWDKKSLQGSELRGKTLGIVGLGRIGLEVAARAQSFGMELVGYDPFISPAVARERGVELVTLDELFKRVDYLTLHVGLTPQTEGIINAESLAKMKKGVRIVNCARGELIVEEALAEALKSGQVAGAALDVFHSEPLKESAYHALETAVLTPHIGGSTNEAQDATGIQLAEQVKAYLKFGVVQNAVNLPSLSHEEYKEMAPYIEMAERLGKFLAHGADGNLESIHLSYSGRLAEGKTELIRNAAICGVLADSAEVNRINAAAIAQERGLRVHEDKKAAASGGAGNVLKLTLHFGGGDSTASATVLHGTSPRLITYDSIDIEAPLQGRLLCFRNKDVPGVIGRIGTILGEHKINIANFALGRSLRSQKVPQGKALAVIQIDAPDAKTQNAAIDALNKVDAIESVRLVELETAETK